MAKFCMNCGAALGEKDNYCSNCGTSVSGDTSMKTYRFGGGMEESIRGAIGTLAGFMFFGGLARSLYLSSRSFRPNETVNNLIPMSIAYHAFDGIKTSGPHEQVDFSCPFDGNSFGD